MLHYILIKNKQTNEQVIVNYISSLISRAHPVTKSNVLNCKTHYGGWERDRYCKKVPPYKISKLKQERYKLLRQRHPSWLSKLINHKLRQEEGKRDKKKKNEHASDQAVISHYIWFFYGSLWWSKNTIQVSFHYTHEFSHLRFI